ncbi:MAG: hypothetical protein KKE11_03605 [Gammaproteobacteria bacterium]|nr:hypothetical protein [Gammaproteobacteria bacterium]
MWLSIGSFVEEVIIGVSGFIANRFYSVIDDPQNIKDRQILDNGKLGGILSRISYTDVQNVNGKNEILFSGLMSNETTATRLIVRDTFKCKLLEIIDSLGISVDKKMELLEILQYGNYSNLLNDFDNKLKGVLSEQDKDAFISGVKSAIIGAGDLLDLVQGGVFQAMAESFQPPQPRAVYLDEAEATFAPPPPPPPPMPGPLSEETFEQKIKRIGGVATLPGALLEQIRAGAELRKASEERLGRQLSAEEIKKSAFVSELTDAVKGRKNVLKSHVDIDKMLKKREEDLKTKQAEPSEFLKNIRNKIEKRKPNEKQHPSIK